MPHGDCNLCLPSYRANQTWGNCDLLDVFGSVCAEMPGRLPVPIPAVAHFQLQQQQNNSASSLLLVLQQRC